MNVIQSVNEYELPCRVAEETSCSVLGTIFFAKLKRYLHLGLGLVVKMLGPNGCYEWNGGFEGRD